MLYVTVERAASFAAAKVQRHRILAQPRTGWICRRCGRPYPCPTWTGFPLDGRLRTALLPGFLRMAQQAVRDLRGRPGGPTPPEIVRRFLWFVPLNEDEARAIAPRVC
ncbi:hypothetical protein [Micromonospora sp. MW-13]|uniref:hypothetical protein n=1 Tax=Micromonospora sp. MW-13 TaxID=2094022 RepID=UPI001FB1E656|nr:hypothetical protein [Micromonospora sp. MW-13]